MHLESNYKNKPFKDNVVELTKVVCPSEDDVEKRVILNDLYTKLSDKAKFIIMSVFNSETNRRVTKNTMRLWLREEYGKMPIREQSKTIAEVLLFAFSNNHITHNNIIKKERYE